MCDIKPIDIAMILKYIPLVSVQIQIDWYTN